MQYTFKMLTIIYPANKFDDAQRNKQTQWEEVYHNILEFYF